MARGAPSLYRIEIRDQRLLASLDRTHTEAARLAGESLACRLGCTQCCYGPFAITALDAWRLRGGLAQLSPALAEAVRLRAAAYREAIRDLPLDEDGLPVGADDLPCPALDEATGGCDLYAWRPVTCRVFGPLARLEDGGLGHCELCYGGVADEDKPPMAVEFDPEGWEQELIDLFGTRSSTLVARALAG